MFDYSLYLVTDKNLSKGRSNLKVVEAAARGGITCVQFRDKEIDDRIFLAEAKELKRLLTAFSLPLIINDRVEIAGEVGAQGLHLGQGDMPISMARRILGSSITIGVSAESLEDAVRAEQDGADYIGVSPVFPTNTKKDIGAPLGLEGIKEIRRRVKIPLVGIGGINLGNAAQVIQAGADGIAVVSAIVSSTSPEEASRALLQKVQSAWLL